MESEAQAPQQQEEDAVATKPELEVQGPDSI